MADKPKTPVNYTLSDAGKKHIAEHAQLAAELLRAKTLEGDPAYDLKKLDKECETCRQKETKELTEGITKVVAKINEMVNGLEEDEMLKLNVGSTTVRIDSQEKVDESVRALVVVNHSVNVRQQMRYYDMVLDMRKQLDTREKGMKDGTMPPFNDLEMMRISALNADIRRAGEENGIDAGKLQLDEYARELRAFDSRLKEKTNPTPYEARQMEDDKRRLALVKDWKGKEELAQAELKKKLSSPCVVLERSPGIQASTNLPPQTIPDSSQAIPNAPQTVPNAPQLVPNVPQLAPMPRKKEPGPGGMQFDGISFSVVPKAADVFAEAAGDVRAILAGNSAFATEFSTTPAVKRDTKELAV